MAGTERPYRVDDEWSRCVLGRRTGAAAAFLEPYLRPGMRLIDCGCGPGSITADLAKLVVPGLVVGVDLRSDALGQARALAREHGITNLEVVSANIYRLLMQTARLPRRSPAPYYSISAIQWRRLSKFAAC